MRETDPRIDEWSKLADENPSVDKRTGEDPLKGLAGYYFLDDQTSPEKVCSGANKEAKLKCLEKGEAGFEKMVDEALKVMADRPPIDPDFPSMSTFFK